MVVGSRSCLCTPTDLLQTPVVLMKTKLVLPREKKKKTHNHTFQETEGESASQCEPSSCTFLARSYSLLFVDLSGNGYVSESHVTTYMLTQDRPAGEPPPAAGQKPAGPSRTDTCPPWPAHAPPRHLKTVTSRVTSNCNLCLLSLIKYILVPWIISRPSYITKLQS